MAIAVSRTADGIGAVYTSSGVLTGRDLIEADDWLHAEARSARQLRYLLVDHSAAPEERIEAESMGELAQRAARTLALLEDGIVAIVAPNDVLYGLSRMWQIQAEQPGLAIGIHRKREEALSWLEARLKEKRLPFRLTE